MATGRPQSGVARRRLRKPDYSQKVKDTRNHLAVNQFQLRKREVEDGSRHRKINSLEVDLETGRQTYRLVSEEMKRLYLSRESELSVKVHSLEMKLTIHKQVFADLSQKIKDVEADTTLQLDRLQQEHEKILQEKLNIQYSYEKLIHESFDTMTSKVLSARNELGGSGMEFQSSSKKLLQEFGFNPLDM